MCDQITDQTSWTGPWSVYPLGVVCLGWCECWTQTLEGTKQPLSGSPWMGGLGLLSNELWSSYFLVWALFKSMIGSVLFYVSLVKNVFSSCFGDWSQWSGMPPEYLGWRERFSITREGEEQHCLLPLTPPSPLVSFLICSRYLKLTDRPPKPCLWCVFLCIYLCASVCLSGNSPTAGLRADFWIAAWIRCVFGWQFISILGCNTYSLPTCTDSNVKKMCVCVCVHVRVGLTKGVTADFVPTLFLLVFIRIYS